MSRGYPGIIRSRSGITFLRIVIPL